MELQWYLLGLLVVLKNSRCETQNCPDSRIKNINLLLEVKQNLTGHWIFTVDALNKDQIGKGNVVDPDNLLLDVDYTVNVCENEQSVRMRATAVSKGVPVKKPPGDYEKVTDMGYYKIHSTALAWEDARDKCVEEGAHLMIIDNEEEAEMFKKMFAATTRIQNATNTAVALIGISDLKVEGTYDTVLGTPLTALGYTKWAAGQPNGDTSENCGCVDQKGQLYDVTCSTRSLFICEF